MPRLPVRIAFLATLVAFLGAGTLAGSAGCGEDEELVRVQWTSEPLASGSEGEGRPFYATTTITSDGRASRVASSAETEYESFEVPAAQLAEVRRILEQLDAAELRALDAPDSGSPDVTVRYGDEEIAIHNSFFAEDEGERPRQADLLADLLSLMDEIGLKAVRQARGGPVVPGSRLKPLPGPRSGS